MNGKGVVYLFSALFLVTVFLAIMYARTLPSTEVRESSIRSRIATMDDFLKDFHEDVHRATFIASFRSLIAIEEYISEQGAFVEDVGPLFVESFLNGTIENESYEILANSTFGEYIDRVNAEAKDIGVSLNVTILNISLTQLTPWSVDVSFDLVVINLTDGSGLARWDYSKNFVTEVPILDLRDPVFSVYTYGKVPNTFRESPYNNTDFVIGNDTTNLSTEITNMYYREDPHAPSFLQRLAGNLSGSSKYGIAALVDLDDLNAQGLSVDTSRSVVDYVYFANTSTTNYCPGKGEPLPAWFKLDATHYADALHDYGLKDLNASIC